MKSFTCILIILFLTSISNAATYYVSTTGSDSNAGSLTKPFKTIARGSRAMKSGDTLYVRAGTYNETMQHGTGNFIFVNGTSSAYTRYLAYPGEERKVIIKPSVTVAKNRYVVWFSRLSAYIEFKGFVVDGANATYAALRTDGSYVYKDSLTSDGWSHARRVRIINNEIKNSGNGKIEVTPGTLASCVYLAGDNEFIGNLVHNCTSYGIYAYWDKGLIEGNTIHNIGRYAIHIYSTNYRVNNWVIRNNRFYNCGIRGTYKAETGLQQTAAIIISRGLNNRFYNNLVYNNYAGVRIWGNADNTLVANNTIYGNSTYGIKVDGSTNENSRIINNIVWANKSSQITNLGTKTILKTNLTTDPKVVNLSARDFRLQAGSPAINKGTTLVEVPKDFRGVARPRGSAFDIGAYEY